MCGWLSVRNSRRSRCCDWICIVGGWWLDVWLQLPGCAVHTEKWSCMDVTMDVRHSLSTQGNVPLRVVAWCCQNVFLHNDMAAFRSSTTWGLDRPETSTYLFPKSRSMDDTKSSVPRVTPKWHLQMPISRRYCQSPATLALVCCVGSLKRVSGLLRPWPRLSGLGHSHGSHY